MVEEPDGIDEVDPALAIIIDGPCRRPSGRGFADCRVMTAQTIPFRLVIQGRGTMRQRNDTGRGSPESRATTTSEEVETRMREAQESVVRIRRQAITRRIHDLRDSMKER